MSGNSLAVVIDSNQLPESVLTQLQDGWQGSLKDSDYSKCVSLLAERCVEDGMPVLGTLNQIKALGMMGVDLGSLREIEVRAIDSPTKQRVLKEAREDQERSTRKFFGQLGNDENENGALPMERVSFKGMLVAELEKHKGIVSPEFLTSAKRSLALDARAVLSGMATESQLVRELEKLEVDKKDSFIWCSLTVTPNHALDTVVRRVFKDKKAQYELTTCNRGRDFVALDGPETEKVKAKALCSYWPDSHGLAAKWSAQTIQGMAISYENYQESLHPTKETHPNYRPQSTQKKGDCATKSMLAALNFLIEGPGDGSKYKAIKNSLKMSLGHPPKGRLVAAVAAAEPVEVDIRRVEIDKLSGKDDATCIGFLLDKFSGGQKVPTSATIGMLKRSALSQAVKTELKARFDWAKRYL